MIKPKVSIHCTTYNQEKFVRQTLDGFVMQKTNFAFEALIHDDASTDGTVEIIKEYEKKYPDIIKPIYQSENQFSKGISVSKYYNFPRIKSPYVAMCEGDDYFTDENKLQKQADFLDAHPDFSICFHPVRVFYEDGSIPDTIYPTKKLVAGMKVFSIQHLVKFNFIQTNSVMYRWRFNEKENIKDFMPDNILPGDYFIHLLHAQKGKIGMIDEVMSAYRRHKGGIWWGSVEAGADNEALHLKYGIRELNFYVELEKTFPEYRIIHGHKYTAAMAKIIFNIYMKNKRFAEMEQVLKLCPDLFTAN